MVNVTSNCIRNIITVFPNPAAKIINVTGLNGKNKLVILDATGKAVNTKITANQVEKININNLPAGSYMIQVIKAVNY